MSAPNSGSSLGWALRGWLFIEVGFGLAAMASIALHPEDSATNFAWPIKPTVTAALLGAFYVSSAWVFVLAAIARRWEDVRVMILPAVLFTGAELVATFLHWEKFTVGSVPFIVWFASYLLPPPILLACWIWQRKHQALTAPTAPLPSALRILMLALGAVITAEGVLAFFVPSILIQSYPWQLTPLTTRALCGWLIALGTMLTFGGIANDRREARVLAPFFILLLPATGVQLSRFSTEVDWTHWRIFVDGGSLVFVAGVGVYLATADWSDFFLLGRPVAGAVSKKV